MAVYSLIVYRALGFVIIASLVVMGVLTYLALCILAWRMGFRLSLAGVAGLIVSIGFTADSFIVYFERIRDEMRDGKSITGAVEDGWSRAKRTIYISKSINILAAVVLYILADATVKGFAFTLGLTTVIDVIIFILFTHPVMQLLARTKFFGSGHPLSGLDPEALGAVYRGRAQFRAPAVTGAKGAQGRKTARSRGEAERRQTIAERKAAELHGRDQDGRLATRHPQGGRRLMRSMSQLGNDLYSGKTSFPFVGRRRLWFIIAAVLVIASVLVPLVRPVQFSIEFTGGSQFTVSGLSSPEQSTATDAVQSVVPGTATKVTTIGGTAVRVQTDQMTPEETQQVTTALAEAYGVDTSEVTASFIGPSWGADVTRQSLWGLAIFLALTFLILALYFRTWKMSAAAIIGVVDVLDHHDRRLRAGRLRDLARCRHRLPDDPVVLAVRHDGRLRQDPREHDRGRRSLRADVRRVGEPRGQPDADPVDQHDGRCDPPGGGDPVHRCVLARCADPQRHLAVDLRRHDRGRVLDAVRRCSAVLVLP